MAKSSHGIAKSAIIDYASVQSPMLETVFQAHLWIALVLWALVYISDYYLTLYAAHLYQTYARDHITFGGSFELTPQFQSDIDNLRVISPRFLFRLSLSLVLISAVWFLAIFSQMIWMFSLLIGALFLREAAVHIRHFRNIVLFHSARNSGYIQGKIEYSRQLVLRQSASDLFGFAVLFLFTYAVSRSWFLLGGALSCAVTAKQHWAMSTKVQKAQKSQVPAADKILP